MSGRHDCPSREEPDRRWCAPTGKVVEHDVEPQSRRRAVDRRVPHRDDDEVAVSELASASSARTFDSA